MNESQRSLALRFAHIAIPPYATDWEPWEWHADAWRRLFTVREWQIAAMTVAVSGEQDHHGHTTHWLYVGGEEQFTDSERQRLRDVLAEADALIEWLR